MSSSPIAIATLMQRAMNRFACTRFTISSGERFFFLKNRRRIIVSPTLCSHRRLSSASTADEDSALSRAAAAPVSAVIVQAKCDSRLAARDFSDGLPLLSHIDYPAEVLGLVESANDPRRSPLAAAVQSVLEIEPTEHTATILMREFCRRDALPAAFACVAAARRLGVPRSRALYRALAFAAAKFEDIEWSLFALELARHDGMLDVPSAKRVFDACTASVDLRGWSVYDVLCYEFRLSSLARANMRTSMYLTQLLRYFGMKRSARARRGFITLPNPRGEWSNPWRHTVDGLQVYLEFDQRRDALLDPEEYTQEQRELQEVMLELEDGTRIRERHLGIESSSAKREAARLLARGAESWKQKGISGDFNRLLDFKLKQ